MPSYTGYRQNGIPFDDLFVKNSQFTNGGLWVWGFNNNGQLGDNTITSRSSPIQTISGGLNWKQSSGGTYMSASIKTDGALWLWGYNVAGGLGDGTSTNKSSPIQTVSTGTNWEQVSAGYYHTASIKTDGSLWLWGYNHLGQLGANFNVNTVGSSPIQTVSTGTNWKQISCGSSMTSAIKTDGTLWTWGRNLIGALGDNSTTHKSSPVQTVAGGTNWKLVSSGNYYSAAIKTDGTLWTWGNNSYGSLGDNSTVNKSSPVQTAAGGTNWKQVTVGNRCVVSIKTDGTLWAWGHNAYGQLGDNTSVNKSSPVQTISGGNNWKYLAPGTAFSFHAGAIKTDGTLWLWGLNTAGALGDNSSTNKSSPVQTVSGGTNWKYVALGDSHTIAIRDQW